MIVGRVLHQQVFQLKWHFLACVALIMVLPLEGAIVNLHAGDGFYSSAWTGVTLLLAPLLAGLIACANVQADLDEKRYLFWRSKPAGVWPIVSLKYVAGLLMALAIMACPILFTVVTRAIGVGERPDRYFLIQMIFLLLISLLAYSVCFFTNVLVRKTARAWLIGMTLTCFVLLTPFILPLGFKDIVSDITFFRASAMYLSVALGTTLLAFVLAVLAVKHNWHLLTSLRGLLWAGAGLIFGLMLLFGRQVANIRILDEKRIPGEYFGHQLEKPGDKTVLLSRHGWQNRHELATDGGRISLNHIQETPSEATRAQMKVMHPGFADEEGLSLLRGQRHKDIYYEIGSELYLCTISAYYFDVNITNEYGDTVRKEKRWKKLYLRNYHISEGMPIARSSLDLSDCLIEDRGLNTEMRLIKDGLLALFVNHHCMAVQASDKGDLQVIERKKMKAYSAYARSATDRKQTFKLPLIPLESIDIKDRVRLSIDFSYWPHGAYSKRGFRETSRVHMGNDQTVFVLVSHDDIARFDVIKWDQENIHCRFRDVRPFTFLEQRGISHRHDACFVQNGILYAHEWNTFMVFDIASQRGIRKLGHFERLGGGFGIEHIRVEDNGNILMFARSQWAQKEHWSDNWALYLLKNPQ